MVLDTWPGEPSLSAELLSLCDWVSPHIAGHSIKARESGSDLLAEAVARWAGVEVATLTELVNQDGSAVTGQTPTAECAAADSEVTAWMAEFLRQQSILPREDARLREAATAGLTSVEFDRLRKSYQQPAEWTGESVTIAPGDDELHAVAEQLGWKVTPK